MVRVVLDTNVLVSALISDGKPRRLVLKLSESHTMILCSQMLAELADVLLRNKFCVKNYQVESFLSVLVKTCKMVSYTPRFRVVSEDPDDDVALNVACGGKADYLVTGDKHLLALNRFKKTRIVTVSQMLEMLSAFRYAPPRSRRAN